MDCFRKFEKRDLAELIPDALPEPIEYRSHREFVRKVLKEEVSFRAQGKQIGKKPETAASRNYREQLNSMGSPSDMIAAGYKWKPGTELAEETPDIKNLEKRVA
jgi:hypothetical protein